MMIGLWILAAATGASNPVPDPACSLRAMAAPSIVAVEGTKLAYVRCGSGSPTVVFEGGFGGDLQNWDALFPAVGRFAPVFAYSRPGFKGSSVSWKADADGMRTSTEAAHLLHDALVASHVKPPYVLVGHSLGGLYIQKFAQLFPRDAAGLVLMDNRPATQMKRCAAEGVPECINLTVSPDWSPALKTTFLGIEPSEAVAPTPRQLGRIAVLVITAGKAEAGFAERSFEKFRAAQGEFSAQLRHGRQVIVPDATHSSLSHEQAPEVAAEIERFWEATPNRR